MKMIDYDTELKKLDEQMKEAKRDYKLQIIAAIVTLGAMVYMIYAKQSDVLICIILLMGANNLSSKLSNKYDNGGK